MEGFGASVDNQEWYFKNESKNIFIEKHATNMFIETDRPIYKPGQKSKKFKLFKILLCVGLHNYVLVWIKETHAASTFF